MVVQVVLMAQVPLVVLMVVVVAVVIGINMEVAQLSV
jgi:hypothetical protein